MTLRSSLLNLLKIFLPPKIRHLLRDWWWKKSHLGKRKLPSGLIINIQTFHDWVIYEEIFSKDEYRKPLEEMLHSESEDEKLIIADLGANIGYFALHVADLIESESRRQRDYSLLLVEGARSNFARLRRQLTQNGRLASRITLHHGLVGKQTGVGNLNEGEIHYGSHVAEQEGQGTYQVSYLNLDELFSSYPTIHFLKCDIEGSEGDFIMNYPDLLRKTRHICVETHSAKLFKLCSQRLHELGFSPPEVLSQLEHEGLQQTTFSCVRRPSR